MQKTLTIRNRFLLPLLGGIILAVILAAVTHELPSPVFALRLLAGLLAALIIPGFCFQLAFFPENNSLDGPERLGLSFGLSIALIPQILILLDFLPWGIRMVPISISYGVISLISLLAATIRLTRLPPEQRFRIVLRIDYHNWIADLSKRQKILYAVFASALLIALISATVILVSPSPNRAYTEFYLLNANGTANDYPRAAAVNRPVTLQVGIFNQESVDLDYRIEVHQSGQSLTVLDPITTSPGKRLEVPLVFTPDIRTAEAPIDIYLYRKGESVPYRTLRLWMKIDSAQNNLLGSGN